MESLQNSSARGHVTKYQKNGLVKQSFLEICFDVLSLCKKNPCKKTKIMRKCNLSHSQLQVYVELLVDLKFLTITDGVYQVLDKGQEYIEAFIDLEYCLRPTFELGRVAYHEIQVTKGHKRAS